MLKIFMYASSGFNYILFIFFPSDVRAIFYIIFYSKVMSSPTFERDLHFVTWYFGENL